MFSDKGLDIAVLPAIIHGGSLLFFFKLTFSKNSFRNNISVKQFRPRSGPTKLQA